MRSNLKNNKTLFYGFFIFIFVYIVLVKTVHLETLTVVFNGLFFGSLTAIVVAFGEILFNSLKGITPYDRVRQMTIGFFLTWVALFFFTFSSLYLQSRGITYNSTFFGFTARYVAVIAAWVQLTAPDFGLGIFHGRDRKILYLSVFSGAAISMFLIYAQNFQILATN